MVYTLALGSEIEDRCDTGSVKNVAGMPRGHHNAQTIIVPKPNHNTSPEPTLRYSVAVNPNIGQWDAYEYGPLDLMNNQHGLANTVAKASRRTFSTSTPSAQLGHTVM